MAKDLKSINIVDIESTCWQKEGDKLPGEVSEIIEIGIVSLDIKNLTILQKDSFLIKPQFSKVSPFCTQLTTITQSMLDTQGISLEEALNQIKAQYKPHLRTWGSYGDYDRVQFEVNCKRLNLPNIWGSTHLNIKNNLALKYKLNKELGMSEACKFLNIPLLGTHHRGLDDALNIAEIYKKIMSS
jgi:inhibitor of KinA sporulation pathway (predicted exonuclease)